MAEHPAIAAKCTPAQVRLFEEIAAGTFVSAHPKRVEALVKKGLVEIVTHHETFPQRFTHTAPSVPVSIHMQWCAWCDEHISDQEMDQC